VPVKVKKAPANTGRGGPERRQAPRVEILGQVTGESLTLDAPVTVLDLSTGGFRIETTGRLSTGEPHEFRFKLRDGVSVIVLARVVHQRAVSKRPSGSHVVGLEFLDGSAEAKANRAAIVDRILAETLKKKAG
jgi:PilZ domain-containing protein